LNAGRSGTDNDTAISTEIFAELAQEQAIGVLGLARDPQSNRDQEPT